MRYNGLLMTFNLHDEKLPILLKKNNNKYSYISIREFKNDLNKISEFKIHFEGHSVHGRLPNCDGYIDFQHRFSVDEIIKENDMHKLIKYKDLIKSIIKAHWGDFEFSENNLLAKGGYYIDMPYMVIESYKKKALKIE